MDMKTSKQMKDALVWSRSVRSLLTVHLRWNGASGTLVLKINATMIRSVSKQENKSVNQVGSHKNYFDFLIGKSFR